MSGWSGWEADIIVAVGGANTSELRNFLAEWQKQEPSNCRDNPMLASQRETGSSNCLTLANGKHAQAYTSQTQGKRGTVAQIKSGNYPHLFELFQSGSPWTPLTGNLGLYNDLIKWGVPKFANWYKAQFGDQWQGGSGSGPPGAIATHAHKGWSDLQHMINRDLPTTLRRIDALNKATLRHLRHRSRVR